MKIYTLLFPLVLGATACGHGGPGTVSFTFQVADSVRNAPNLGGTLNGSIYGMVFRSIDVGVTGPATNAAVFATIHMNNVDLTTATVSQAWVSPEIVADHYTFLGMLDVVYKGTHGVQLQPTQGDPVTLPTTNKFSIVPGQQIDVLATFDLVY
jgi:hypothetical protein